EDQMQIKVLRYLLRFLVPLGAVVLLTSISSLAQANVISTPIPGVGHDYIHMLNETVNPATGAVSVRITVPVPPGRGLTLPFAFAYDSGSVHYMKSTGTPGYGGWFKRTGLMTIGGWSYTAPIFTDSEFTKVVGPQNTVCTFFSSYVFQDPTGDNHSFGMAKV